MPKQHHIPVNEQDRLAREAFAAYCDLFGDVAEHHLVSPRLVERIYARQRDVPPGLALEAAARMRALADASGIVRYGQLPEWLNDWADWCDENPRPQTAKR